MQREGVVGGVGRDGDLVDVAPAGVVDFLGVCVGGGAGDLLFEGAAAAGDHAGRVALPVIAQARAEGLGGFDEFLLFFDPRWDNLLPLDHLVHDVLCLCKRQNN